MNFHAFFAQLFELAAALLLAPVLNGWVNKCRAWLQNRSAPPLMQTWYTLSKLFDKEVLLAHNASSLFRAAPYVIFSCMALASAIAVVLLLSTGCLLVALTMISRHRRLVGHA